MVTLQSLLRDKAFYRDVAQLVAHYVRDVGVGRSSRLIPTEDIKSQTTNGVLIFLCRDQGARAPCAANEGQAKWDSVCFLH